jgi:hypothetical protein
MALNQVVGADLPERELLATMFCDVFLADPLHTSVPLPPFDQRRVRYVYRLELDTPPDSTDAELLEEAFRVLNVEHPRDYKERSLSVGDVVTIAESCSYVCDWTGWTRLSIPLRPGDLIARAQPAQAHSDLAPVPE